MEEHKAPWTPGNKPAKTKRLSVPGVEPARWGDSIPPMTWDDTLLAKMTPEQRQAVVEIAVAYGKFGRESHPRGA